MEKFEEEKKRFLEEFAYKDELIKQLKTLDASSVRYGDMCAFGCEFILNGVDTHSKYWSVSDFISDEYDNVYNHGFKLNGGWDTLLYYSPSDFRGLVFDFSHMIDGNKIIAYDGLSKPFSYNVVREFSAEDFLRDYGMKKLLSVRHYNVTWQGLGYSWNN